MTNKYLTDKKAFSNLKARIKKANSSFGVMGSMTLAMELQSMSKEDLKAIQAKLLEGKSPVRFETLDKLAA